MGDFFVIIMLGEDYQRFNETMKKIDEELSYSLIKFEGKKLIFSIAHGYSKYENGLSYKDAFQKADSSMYINTKGLKEKYKMTGR